MNHVIFEHIQETTNILIDFFSRIKSMCLYDMLDPKEEGKDFGHFMFDELPPIATEQEGSTVSINQIQHIPIKLNYGDINRLQQQNLQCSKVVKM